MFAKVEYPGHIDEEARALVLDREGVPDPYSFKNIGPSRFSSELTPEEAYILAFSQSESLVADILEDGNRSWREAIPAMRSYSKFPTLPGTDYAFPVLERDSYCVAEITHSICLACGAKYVRVVKAPGISLDLDPEDEYLEMDEERVISLFNARVNALSIKYEDFRCSSGQCAGKRYGVELTGGPAMYSAGLAASVVARRIPLPDKTATYLPLILNERNVTQGTHIKGLEEGHFEWDSDAAVYGSFIKKWVKDGAAQDRLIEDNALKSRKEREGFDGSLEEYTATLKTIDEENHARYLKEKKERKQVAEEYKEKLAEYEEQRKTDKSAKRPPKPGILKRGLKPKPTVFPESISGISMANVIARRAEERRVSVAEKGVGDFLKQIGYIGPRSRLLTGNSSINEVKSDVASIVTLDASKRIFDGEDGYEGKGVGFLESTFPILIDAYYKSVGASKRAYFPIEIKKDFVVDARGEDVDLQIKATRVSLDKYQDDLRNQGVKYSDAPLDAAIEGVRDALWVLEKKNRRYDGVSMEEFIDSPEYKRFLAVDEARRVEFARVKEEVEDFHRSTPTENSLDEFHKTVLGVIDFIIYETGIDYHDILRKVNRRVTVNAKGKKFRADWVNRLPKLLWFKENSVVTNDGVQSEYWAIQLHGVPLFDSYYTSIEESPPSPFDLGKDLGEEDEYLINDFVSKWFLVSGVGYMYTRSGRKPFVSIQDKKGSGSWHSSSLKPQASFWPKTRDLVLDPFPLFLLSARYPYIKVVGPDQTGTEVDPIPADSLQITYNGPKEDPLFNLKIVGGAKPLALKDVAFESLSGLSGRYMFVSGPEHQTKYLGPSSGALSSSVSRDRTEGKTATSGKRDTSVALGEEFEVVTGDDLESFATGEDY